MAFTPSDIDALDSAIANGVLSVRYADGKSVTYRSTIELIAARNFANDQVNNVSGSHVMLTSFDSD